MQHERGVNRRVTTSRELIRDGVQWHVYEIEVVPEGADHASRRCLIFNGEMIMRRVWSYTPDWMRLADDDLFALASAAPGDVVTFDTPSSGVPAFDVSAPIVSSAVEAAARAQTLSAAACVIRDTTRTLREERAALLETNRKYRAEMRAAVERYAETLRRSGTTPEVALRQVKAAICDGIGAAGSTDEPGSQALMDDAVTWCISAYYAA